MWYFTWILGTAFAVSFGVINALWFEFYEETQNRDRNQKTAK